MHSARVIPQQETFDAGEFGTWLRAMRQALLTDVGTDVACGDCRGCCTSAYYVPLRDSDARARAVVPIQFIVYSSDGRQLIKAHEDGRCPMLREGNCSIYSSRPQTCRDYDCRVFAAAGMEAGAERSVINERVRAWRFRYASDADRKAHAAVQRAATFIRGKRLSFRAPVPTSPTGIAVLAVKTYDVFLRPDFASLGDEEIALAIVEANRAFDARATA